MTVIECLIVVRKTYKSKLGLDHTIMIMSDTPDRELANFCTVDNVKLRRGKVTFWT